MLAGAILVLCLGGALAQDNPCEGIDDGVIVHWGCRSYTVCLDEEPVIIDCDEGLVFDPENGQCDDPANVGPPCGILRDCTGKDDGYYRDFATNCTAYFTCINELFFGHNECSADLVFDTDETCTCVFPDDAGECEDDDSYCPLQ